MYAALRSLSVCRTAEAHLDNSIAHPVRGPTRQQFDSVGMEGGHLNASEEAREFWNINEPTPLLPTANSFGLAYSEPLRVLANPWSKPGVRCFRAARHALL